MLLLAGGLLGAGVLPASADRGPTTLYVAQAGRDTGNTCGSPSAPCATLAHALAEAANGSTIEVSGIINQAAVFNRSVTVSGLGFPGGSPAVLRGRQLIAPDRSVAFAGVTMQGSPSSAVVAVSGATLSLTGVTVTGNGTAGGAALVTGPATRTTIFESTIAGNGGAFVHGEGAIDNHGLLTVVASTIADNRAGAAGSAGGILNDGWVVVGASILAGNTSRGTPADCAGRGPFFSLGYNLTDTAARGSCGLTQPTDLVDANPALAALAGNGGPTDTMLPALAGPAVGVIPPGTNLAGRVVCGDGATDQRGDARPAFGNRDCAIGAAEVGHSPHLYAYAPGLTTSAGAPAGCPEQAEPSSGCSLAAALDIAAAGDTVYLATPGSSQPYVGNWDVDPPGTAPSVPLAIEPAPGSSGAVLDGNAGAADGCSTTSCDGPVLEIGAGVSAAIEGITIQHANSAGAGGAIDTGDGVAGGTVTVSDSTFVGNQAGADGGAIDNGDHGGSGTVSISDSTFVGNRAAAGTAVDNGGPAGTVFSAANVFSGACVQGGGTWQDLGYNVAIDSSCLAGSASGTGPGDTIDPSLAAQLSSLGDLGGPTETVAPLPGNPAVGLIPPGTSATLDGSARSLCPTTDQRGVASAAGQSCASGALQLASDTTTLSVQGPSDTTGSPGATASSDTSAAAGATGSSDTTGSPGATGSPGTGAAAGATGSSDTTGSPGATGSPGTSAAAGATASPDGAASDPTSSDGTGSPDGDAQTGATVTFTATVSPAASPAGLPVPTGTVTVSDRGGTVCTITLADGTDSCSTSTSDLSPGTDELTATYDSTNGYLTSTATATETVPVLTTVAVAVVNQTLTFSPVAQPAVLSATVTSTDGTVNTGTVQFSVLQGVTALGAVTSAPVVDGTATATYSLPPATSTGTYAVDAAYKAAGHFTTSSTKTKLTVAKARQVLSIKHLGTTAVVGGSATPVATSSSGLPVSLSLSSSSSGVCQISHGRVTFSHPGTCTIQAKQPGDAEYQAAAPVTRAVRVTAAVATSAAPTTHPASRRSSPPRESSAPTTTPGQKAAAGPKATGAPKVLTFGTPPTIRAVSRAAFTIGRLADVGVRVGGLPTPRLRVAGRLPAGLRLREDGAGSADLVGSPQPGAAGTYRIRLTATNANGVAIRALTLQVRKAVSQLRVLGPAEATVGQLVSFDITVAGGGSPLGTVSFRAGSLRLGQVLIGASGRANFSTTALPVGEDAVIVRYSGNDALLATVGELRVRIRSAEALALGPHPASNVPSVTPVPFTDGNLIRLFGPAGLVFASGLGLVSLGLLRRRKSR